MWPFSRHRVKTSPELEHARASRQRAEELLARDLEHVILPLHEIRRTNHIQADISRAIRQRIGREEGT